VGAPGSSAGEAAPSPEELERLAAEAESAIAAAADRAAWEALRVAWTGARQGRLRELQALIPRAADKRAYGQGFNRLKQRVEAALAARDAELAAAERAAAEAAARVDVTLPGRRPVLGALHPVTLVSRQIEAIFRGLGYSVAEGPEVESDEMNFARLNFPADHPARDAQDTLFLTDGRLLRTHTSPVQVRTMLARKPPIRVICPGRVYRNDNDLRHSPMFHQIEGLCVAEGITVGDLKGTLEAFVTRLFAADTTHPAATELLPLHRAFVRGRHHLPALPWRGMRDLLGQRLDGDPGRRHGRSARARELRDRPRPLLGLRLRPRSRPRGDEPVGDPQHPRPLRG
jgi:phenylalanyl-tRNA synthetase alpha chain